MILCFGIIALSIILDQLTKILAVQNLAPAGSVVVIPKILNFTYVENRGAAFGMLADHRWVFMVISCVAIVALGAYLIVKKPKSYLERISLALIVGGGIGNMIDRFRLGYVVDFIDATFVDFYVFNVADSAVCVGCGLLILYLIFTEILERREKSAPKT